MTEAEVEAYVRGVNCFITRAPQYYRDRLCCTMNREEYGNWVFFLDPSGRVTYSKADETYFQGGQDGQHESP